MDEHWQLEQLIRDRIPELIEAPGQATLGRQLDDSAIRPYLAYKLLEEAREAYQVFLSGDREGLREELADVLEVLERMAALSGLDCADVRLAQARKAQERGRFLANPLLTLQGNPASRLHVGPRRPLLQVLRHQLAHCRSAYLAVAFVMDSGLAMLGNAFAAALARGARIRLLTTDYLDITEPEALEQLISLPGDIDVRLYSELGRSYHPKAYLFEHGEACVGRGVAFIGSSNLSHSALETGIEWNYEIWEEDGGWPLHDFIQHFQALFDSPHSRPVTPELIADYRDRRQPRSLIEEEQRALSWAPPTPRPAQVEALTQLEALREEGECRGLVIAATGIGKTYLAAFDSRPFARVLFIAHRLELLIQAERSFRDVRPFDQTGFYHGERRDAEADLLFASIHSLGQVRHLQRFAPDYFDYVVVDEFHHAAAARYRAILDYFKPQFLLGLTATPYRGDNRDIFALCHGNVAYRLTLFEAIGFGWLSPFRYFGVYDDTDYSAIPWRSGHYDESALSQALENQQRAAAVLEAYRRQLSRAALGFCASISHARFMADYFNQCGIAALAVHSGADSIPRDSAIEALGQGAVSILFTVDLFNEGVDLPQVDLVLFLRPTESMTVFLQQLGRGLRLHPGKAHLTALDFIGNYKNAHYKLPLLAGEAEPDAAAACRAVKALEMGTFEHCLPAGVEVCFDLRAIDLFKVLAQRKEPLQQRLIEAFQALRDELDHRPSLLEVHRQGRYDVRQYLQTFGNWYRFLAAQAQLSAAEIQL